MKNKEKARKIGENYTKGGYRETVYAADLEDALKEMAEWKDAQFAKEKKRWLEWLKKNAGTYHRFDVNDNRFFYNYNAMIEAFQQAMEE